MKKIIFFLSFLFPFISFADSNSYVSDSLNVQNIHFFNITGSVLYSYPWFPVSTHQFNKVPNIIYYIEDTPEAQSIADAICSYTLIIDRCILWSSKTANFNAFVTLSWTTLQFNWLPNSTTRSIRPITIIKPSTPVFKSPTQTRKNEILNLDKNTFCDFVNPNNYFTNSISVVDNWNSATITCQTEDPKIKTVKTLNYTTVDITWYFDNAVVPYGALTFNLTLHTNEPAEMQLMDKYDIWDRFEIVSVTPNPQNSTITFTLQQFDHKPINVACTAYSLNIRSSAIRSTVDNLSINSNPILWQFTFTGCPNDSAVSASWSMNFSGALTIPQAELSASGTYMPLVYQKDGISYLDFKALGLLVFYILLCFSFFYAIFRIFKKSR